MARYDPDYFRIYTRTQLRQNLWTVLALCALIGGMMMLIHQRSVSSAHQRMMMLEPPSGRAAGSDDFVAMRAVPNPIVILQETGVPIEWSRVYTSLQDALAGPPAGTGGSGNVVGILRRHQGARDFYQLASHPAPAHPVFRKPHTYASLAGIDPRLIADVTFSLRKFWGAHNEVA